MALASRTSSRSLIWVEDSLAIGFLAGDSSTPIWLGLLAAAPVFFIGLIWLVFAGTVALKGEAVDKPNRMAQLYGYTVCLVSLITGLLSASSLLDAAFDRANPLQAEVSFGASLTSFEAYKATYHLERQSFGPPDPAAPPDTASEATLRQRYDALVADRLASTRYRTAKSLMTSSFLLLFAAILFGLHWRWVRRLNGASGAAG